MVTIEQVKAGILDYVETDILPHLSGWKKIALGAYVVLAADGLPALLAQYQNNPAVKMMGVISESGQIDIDRLYQAILPQVQGGEKITIQFPVIGGEYTMDKSDIEKIYKNIKE